MEGAPVVAGVRTAADRDKAARAGAIELGDDDAADADADVGGAPGAPRKRRRVEPPPALTALPTPKPADRAELTRLRKQLTARRPTMIYEQGGFELEEPIPHPEGLPPLLDQFARVKAAVGELRRRGTGRDPMKELLLLRQCASCGPAQTVMAARSCHGYVWKLARSDTHSRTRMPIGPQC